MTTQFHDVFTRVRVGRHEEGNQSAVNYFPRVRVKNRLEGDSIWLGVESQVSQEQARQRQCAFTTYADDADSATSGRRRERNDSVRRIHNSEKSH